jgi:hypothetical protein
MPLALELLAPRTSLPLLRSLRGIPAVWKAAVGDVLAGAWTEFLRPPRQWTGRADHRAPPRYSDAGPTRGKPRSSSTGSSLRVAPGRGPLRRSTEANLPGADPRCGALGPRTRSRSRGSTLSRTSPDHLGADPRRGGLGRGRAARRASTWSKTCPELRGQHLRRGSPLRGPWAEGRAATRTPVPRTRLMARCWKYGSRSPARRPATSAGGVQMHGGKADPSGSIKEF